MRERGERQREGRETRAIAGCAPPFSREVAAGHAPRKVPPFPPRRSPSQKPGVAPFHPQKPRENPHRAARARLDRAERQGRAFDQQLELLTAVRAYFAGQTQQPPAMAPPMAPPQPLQQQQQPQQQ